MLSLWPWLLLGALLVSPARVVSAALLLAAAERVVVPVEACDSDGFVPERATSVVVSPGAPDRVLSSVDRTVYRTTTDRDCLHPSDDGLAPRPPFFRPTEPVHLTVDPHNSEVVYLAAVQGVFRSADGGLSWSWRSLGVPFVLNEAGVETVAVDPARPEILYAGSWYGAFKSVNAGDSWFGVSAGLIVPPFIAPGVQAFAFDPRDTDVVYAASNGVYKTGSGGFFWSRASFGLPGGATQDVLVDAVDFDVVYAATADGVFRSTNGAERWEPLALRGTLVYSLEQDPHDPGVLLAGTELGVFMSRNGGRAWTLILGREASGYVLDTAIALSDRESFYAAAEKGLFATHDGGQTWTVLPLSRPTTTVVPPR
jgi:photosystem II stability/assembly factor-like uncharacterized protein